jgi:hypothetical protein
MPDPGAPPPTKTPRETFETTAVIQKLASAGADADIRSDGTLTFTPHNGGQVRTRQKFTVTPRSAAKDSKTASDPVEVTLDLSLTRLRGQLDDRWIVSSYAESDPSKDSVSTN